MRNALLFVVLACVLSCGRGGSGGNSDQTTQPVSTTPAIVLSPGAVSFSAAAGTAGPNPQTITISNGGTGSLIGLTLGTVVYATGQPTGWLAGSLSSTAAPATLTLTPSVGALPVGSYAASIPVASSAPGVTNSPQTVTANLTVTAGAATRLIFETQPAAPNGGALSPAVTVAIADGAGNVVTNATTNVTVALAANAANAALSGTTTVAATGGVATFANLVISKTATGLTLVASATGLASATSAAFNVTVAVAPSIALASAGQSAAFLASPNFSGALTVQAGSQYLIAVVNTDTSFAQSEGFSFTGTPAAAVAAARAHVVSAAPALPVRAHTAVRSSGPAFAVAGRLRTSLARLHALLQMHAAILDQNRRIYARAGNPAAAWASARASASRGAGVTAALQTTIGTVNKVYVPNALTGGCGSVDSIGARTVAVGQHIVILADTSLANWPQANRPDSAFYQTYADEYDQVTWPELQANVGNPLAYDASLSQLGKVTLTIAPTLNNVANAAVPSFTTVCDFYPSRSAAINAGFSNQTEMFYALVPDGINLDVPTWEAELRGTAAHESTHIVSYAERIINGSPTLEVNWLEEGLANEASEIWMRTFNQATWLGHATFLQTVACEIDLGANAPCAGNDTNPEALTFNHLSYLFEYLQAESPTGGEGLGLDAPANFGAGWAMGRWATDQYAGASEGPFIKSLINEPQLVGLRNLSLHTGATVPTLLTYWNIATAIFQAPGYVAADVRTTIPSFNFADIFNVGQTDLTCGGTPCGLFTDSGSPAYPVQPITLGTAASFTNILTAVPGTSASFFLLTAAGAGVETLQLLAPGGAALSSTSGLRVAILRVQ